MRYIFSEVIGRNGILISLLPKGTTALFWLCVVLCAVVAYLLGSFNTAVAVSKGLYKKDVREFGSGNAGMTNMFRVLGKKAGILTALGDVLKALIAVALGFFVWGTDGQYLAGFFCIIGHIFPVYFHFKGGKGVIVAAITVLLIDPLVFGVLVLIWGLMFFATKIISAASVTAAFFYPLVVSFFTEPGFGVLFSFLIAFTVLFMHRENIKRMIRKEEKPFKMHKDEK